MPALTIRHDGMVASGHVVRGTGRAGSVGVHVVAGLDLVIIDGFTIRGFDVGLLAESPVVVVNSEFLDWGTAGIILKGASAWVSFCSFLDQSSSGKRGAAIVADSLAPTVQACLFQISGEKRYFGIGDPRRASWNSKHNIGIATEVFGQATGISDAATMNAAEVLKATLDGVTEDSPGFAVTTPGSEHLRLLSSSPALRLVNAADFPEISGRRFDAATRLPVVDRDDNRRPVQLLTAGAHEMSFSLTRAGRIRFLELIGGLSTIPFDRVASGRDGVFHRMPGTLGNDGVDPTENAVDIQPSAELSVLSYREALVGSSSGYFKAERRNRVAHPLSAPVSVSSDMHGVSALSACGWVKSLSLSADIVVHRPGRGRAQDRATFEVAMRFAGASAPALSLKLGVTGAPGQDITFVAESPSLARRIAEWTRNERWWFFGWSWSGGLPLFYAGSEDDEHLRRYSTRAFVLDPVTEEMTPATAVIFNPIVDPNTDRIWVGSDSDGARAWHGYIDEISIDVGEARTRAEFDAMFGSRAPFPDRSRIVREVRPADVVFGRTADIYVKPPEAFVGELSVAAGRFIEIRAIASLGSDLFVAARRVRQDTWGVYRLGYGSFSTVIEAIPEIYDIAVDRRGHLVLVADDMPLSRIDPTEGVRYEIALPAAAYRWVAISLDNEYIVATATAITVVEPSTDLTDTEPTAVQPLAPQVAFSDIRDLAVTDANELFVLDATRLVRVSFAVVLDLSVPTGLDASIAAGASMTNSGVDFGRLGVSPGDAIQFVSDEDSLTDPLSVVVADDADPAVEDNAGVRIVRSVAGHTILVDRPFVSEVPAAGKQFEARIIRRSATDVVMIDSTVLVDPVAIAAVPDNPSSPLLVADPAARRISADPAVGTVFALRNGALEAAYHLATHGVDLSSITTVAVRVNPTLPAAQVAAALRSRMTWHMEFEGDLSRIKNAASPGRSDLEVPRIALNELLLTKKAAIKISEDADEAMATYSTRFGSEPALDRLWLNDEYENLSELGIMTADGVLLARVAVARMPYDPLCEVRTDWSQTITVGS